MALSQIKTLPFGVDRDTVLEELKINPYNKSYIAEKGRRSNNKGHEVISVHFHVSMVFFSYKNKLHLS